MQGQSEDANKIGEDESSVKNDMYGGALRIFSEFPQCQKAADWQCQFCMTDWNKQIGHCLRTSCPGNKANSDTHARKAHKVLQEVHYRIHAGHPVSLANVTLVYGREVVEELGLNISNKAALSPTELRSKLLPYGEGPTLEEVRVRVCEPYAPQYEIVQERNRGQTVRGPKNWIE